MLQRRGLGGRERERGEEFEIKRIVMIFDLKYYFWRKVVIPVSDQ